MGTEVIDVPARDRYELRLDGRVVGWADYRAAGPGRVVLPYAQIEPALNGRGLGTTLAEAVFADLAARGLHAIPTCSFMASRQPG